MKKTILALMLLLSAISVFALDTFDFVAENVITLGEGIDFEINTGQVHADENLQCKLFLENQDSTEIMQSQWLDVGNRQVSNVEGKIYPAHSKIYDLSAYTECYDYNQLFDGQPRMVRSNTLEQTVIVQDNTNCVNETFEMRILEAVDMGDYFEVTTHYENGLCESVDISSVFNVSGETAKRVIYYNLLPPKGSVAITERIDKEGVEPGLDMYAIRVKPTHHDVFDIEVA